MKKAFKLTVDLISTLLTVSALEIGFCIVALLAIVFFAGMPRKIGEAEALEAVNTIENYALPKSAVIVSSTSKTNISSSSMCVVVKLNKSNIEQLTQQSYNTGETPSQLPTPIGCRAYRRRARLLYSTNFDRQGYQISNQKLFVVYSDENTQLGMFEIQGIEY